MTHRLHISSGNSKLGKTPNLNLPPCSQTVCAGMPCQGKCYAEHPYKQYPNVRIAWDDNYNYYTNNPKEFINDFVQKMKRKKNKKYFRFHSAGEIIDQDHLNDIVYICEQLPETKFLIFTKKYYLDYSKKPKNLKVVFSAWPNLELPKHILKENIAFMLDKKGIETRHIERNTFVCPGISKKTTCEKCRMCWNMKNKDVIFPEH